MKKDIKIQDLIQVWNYTSLSFNLFEVYDIYKSEYGGYIYECFKIAFPFRDFSETFPCYPLVISYRTAGKGNGK